MAAPVGAARTADTWIQTFTGRQFWPLAPDPAAIDIRDIAHALSLLCRFNGHCRSFYSVAEHSVLVAGWVDEPFMAWGLLHDASEAYLADLPRPAKSGLPDYRQAEERLMQAVATRFGLSWPIPTQVKQADAMLLATEKLALMGPEPASWGPLPPPINPAIIGCLSPKVAEELFLRSFYELGLDA